MSEQPTLHEGQRPAKGSTEAQTLAAEFDRLSKEEDPKRRDYVIPPHQERPEAFKWFLAGVMYACARVKQLDTHGQPPK